MFAARRTEQVTIPVIQPADYDNFTFFQEPEQALRLEPGNAQFKENLEQARQKAGSGELDAMEGVEEAEPAGNHFSRIKKEIPLSMALKKFTY